MEKSYNWSNKTILVAEDEPANFLFIQKILKQTNIEILRAENGEQALDLIKEHDDIDAVLMDIYMPIMDGFETAQRIRKIKPELPIIAQTFFDNELEQSKLEASKFDDLIRKPVNINKLLVILEKHLVH